MIIEKRFPRSPIVATPSINPKDNSGGADILFRASITIKKAMPTTTTPVRLIHDG
jgi:hypothetical protein